MMGVAPWELCPADLSSACRLILANGNITLSILQCVANLTEIFNIPFFPSFSVPDVLCENTELIWREGTPFEAMTGRRAPSSHGLLAEVFCGFPQQ